MPARQRQEPQPVVVLAERGMSQGATLVALAERGMSQGATLVALAERGTSRQTLELVHPRMALRRLLAARVSRLVELLALVADPLLEMAE